jgi:glutathione synthase/RimK-type ligase-like ATP-grasp enzyme
MSVRQCSRKLPARRAYCSVADVRIAVLVPDPDYAEPWRWSYDPQAQALADARCDVEALAWTELGDVSGYDLILPLVAWGYHLDYARWLRLLDRAEAERWPIINPPALLRWNGDKAYLAELADLEVATVPTLAVEACCDADLEEARRRFDSDWLVIKPPVSASAMGAHRLGPNDDLPDGSQRRPMIIQPLIEEIARTGEFSLMLFDGEYSHAVVKRPKSGDFRVQEYHGGVTSACTAPPPGAVELAQRALAAAPEKAVYARVDIVADDEGTLRIMELELIEPSLFLEHAPDGGAAFSRSILSVVQKATA